MFFLFGVGMEFDKEKKKRKSYLRNGERFEFLFDAFFFFTVHGFFSVKIILSLRGHPLVVFFHEDDVVVVF